MAIDVFKWCTQIQGGAAGTSITDNIRTAQFGNGYIQTAGSGIQGERRSVQVIHGSKAEWRSVYNFVREHKLKPFIWTPPDGDIGLFIVVPDSVTLSPKGGGVYEVGATFEERFSSM
ncbi:phage tail protein [Gibbsiella quercinecans]|uniref:phage tail protein n=1 Tax=Gibbsiella quercinecans TaxID=929813 RepID=UPI003C6D8854